MPIVLLELNLHVSGGTIKLDHLGPVIGERSIPVSL